MYIEPADDICVPVSDPDPGSDSSGSDSDYDDFDYHEDSMDLDVIVAKVSNMCREYIGLVTDNKMTQSGAIASVKIHRAFMDDVFSDYIVTDLLPKTYYMMQKLAQTQEEIAQTYENNIEQGRIYDVCPNDDNVFPFKQQERLRDVRADEQKEHFIPENCNLCGNVRTDARQLLYFCVVDRCRKMWSCKQTRELLL